MSTSEPRHSFLAVRYSGMEDRLNPIPPEGVDETTLGGYPAVHGRAVALEGSDGQAYTVAIETEAPEAGSGRWAAYLIFLRWAQTGSAIMGHLETGDLTQGESEEEARTALEAFPLTRVKEILEECITRAGRDLSDQATAPEPPNE